VEAEIELVALGGITSPKGFYAGAAYAGIKKKGDNALDLSVLYSQASSATAA